MTFSTHAKKAKDCVPHYYEISFNSNIFLLPADEDVAFLEVAKLGARTFYPPLRDAFVRNAAFLLLLHSHGA